jgi:hypothetical protein
MINLLLQNNIKFLTIENSLINISLIIFVNKKIKLLFD